MLSRIKFPVVVELIPCSVAQGIHLRTSRKYLNSQPFSMRIFAEKRRIPENSLFFPCMRCRSGRPNARSITGTATFPRPPQHLPVDELRTRPGEERHRVGDLVRGRKRT